MSFSDCTWDDWAAAGGNRQPPEGCAVCEGLPPPRVQWRADPTEREQRRHVPGVLEVAIMQVFRVALGGFEIETRRHYTRRCESLMQLKREPNDGPPFSKHP